MLENVDELLLCRPYIGICALVVGRVDSSPFQVECEDPKNHDFLVAFRSHGS